ncbi:unnamed protein product [Echinostoma caproni]|uniref:C2H2-type domain-containing protein n=1 Tax=Echinostoma caproni TaxID=27848 RepID=A0A183A440_9TREM|nr:unnamed protein product [Echinostoma caproni]
MRGTSEATERIFRLLGIKIAHKPASTVRSSLVNSKDRVEQHERSGVNYAIPFLGCNQHCMGETGKQLHTRLHEHKLTLRRTDPKSQIWNHCARTGHEIVIDNAKVVTRAKRGERLILEALHSVNSFNRHVEIDKHYVILAKPVTIGGLIDVQTAHRRTKRR